MPGSSRGTYHGVRILVIARDPADRPTRPTTTIMLLVRACRYRSICWSGRRFAFLEAFFRDGASENVQTKSVGTCRPTATVQNPLKVKRSCREALRRRAGPANSARPSHVVTAPECASLAPARGARAVHFKPRLVVRVLTMRKTFCSICSEDLNDAEKAASEMGRVAAHVVCRHSILMRPLLEESTTPARSTKDIMQ